MKFVATAIVALFATAALAADPHAAPAAAPAVPPTTTAKAHKNCDDIKDAKAKATCVADAAKEAKKETK